MGCGPSDSAVHESKGWDAGVVGRKPLLKCLHRGTKWKILDNEDNAFFLPCDMSSLFFYGGNGNSSTYVLTFFRFFLLILNASSWTWPCLLIFSAFILVLLPIPSDCSPPLPPRPWRSVRTQGWPSPSGYPTSTTSSWRRSWTSRGSSTSPSATRWAAQLLCLLLFRTSFLPWSLMSVCPPLLLIRRLGTEGSREQSLCLDGVNRIHNSIFDKIWVENMGKTYH